MLRVSGIALGVPLNNGENLTSNPQRNPSTLSLTMQVPNHAGHSPQELRRPIEAAHERIPSNRLRPARGAALPSGGHSPARGAAFSSSGLRLARGYAPPSAGVRHARGCPSRVRRPRTRAFNALTPQDGAIMRPGLAPRCRRTYSPGRSPSPPLWEGTVQCGRCQSRDTVRTP
jgi:hypothetical protein